MYSILHISDLHRSAAEPITNAELVSALIADRDRYRGEDPAVPPPDAIVVSGDLVQGVALGVADFAEQLAQQYRVAEDFLGDLAHRFLGGDRSRVVIVPGNHDIDWNTARSAMLLVPEKDVPVNLGQALLREDSPYRWDWKTRQLYTIADRGLYELRFATYWDFFERFYSGVPGLLRVHRGLHAQLFSLNDGKIGVAAFNSCHGNDCFAFHGSIPPEAIAQAHLDLAPLAFDLRIATWHHSIEGPPYRTDYMDVDLVRGMIGRGFRLGLYGHQHKAQATPQQVFLPDRETMAVVSAGSLCAGAHELPTGVHRQYNVIELADDLQGARVHVRAMLAANLFGRASLNDFGGRSFATLKWEPPKDLGGRTVDAAGARLQALVARAEEALKTGRPADAARLLAPHHAILGQHGRRLLVEAALEAQDWALILAITDPPRAVNELVARVEACLKTREYAGARAALDRFAEDVALDAATARDLRARVIAEETIHR
jgi:calcineurin-like phosphoesterase family protein